MHGLLETRYFEFYPIIPTVYTSLQWWKWSEGSGGTTVTTLLLYFAFVLVHSSTNYQNCTVQSAGTLMASASTL